MIYVNRETDTWYYGGSITIMQNGMLFSGIPTIQQLTDWGFVEYIPPTPPEPEPEPEPSDEDELDPYDALQIITGGIEE